MTMLYRSLSGIFTVLAVFAMTQLAWADGSCTALLASKAKQAKVPGTDLIHAYNIELTMHREDVKFVSYSSGSLTPSTDGSFSGDSNQLFSDRRAGNQPFDISRADQLHLSLSPTGFLKIHYIQNNGAPFDTSWDMSCKGSLLTTYLPGTGVVTLTFRDLVDIIF